MDYKRQLLTLYEMLPFHEHPLWKAVLNHDLSVEQVLQAEIQHYLRTKAGQKLRYSALNKSRSQSKVLFEALLETYLEECTNQRSGPSHLDLIRRLLIQGGVAEDEIDNASPTPGNAAAMALYSDICNRGAGCHILGAGVVEYYYADLCPKIYKTYTEKYGMSHEQAETYFLHGSMDKEHANRAFNILNEAIQLHSWVTIEQSVRDALVATSLHYDGMLHAGSGVLKYWDGGRL